jgi:hypothetical protein
MGKIHSPNHDNKPSHSAFSVRKFLANHNIPLLSANQSRRTWKKAKVLYFLTEKDFKRQQILDVSKITYTGAGTEHPYKEM